MSKFSALAKAIKGRKAAKAAKAAERYRMPKLPDPPANSSAAYKLSWNRAKKEVQEMHQKGYGFGHASEGGIDDFADAWLDKNPNLRHSDPAVRDIRKGGYDFNDATYYMRRKWDKTSKTPREYRKAKRRGLI